jgi:hypothetical protein
VRELYHFGGGDAVVIGDKHTFRPVGIVGLNKHNAYPIEGDHQYASCIREVYFHSNPFNQKPSGTWP